MTPITIPKYDCEKDQVPCWMPIVDSTSRRPLRPLIRCICGRYCDITNHYIHPDGRVTESFLDASPADAKIGCGWHVYLKLENWDGRELRPGAQ